MPVGHRGPATLAAPRPTIAPGHLSRGPRLVDKDQPLGVEVGLGLEPGPTTTQNVRPLLFAGVGGFF